MASAPTIENSCVRADVRPHSGEPAAVAVGSEPGPSPDGERPGFALFRPSPPVVHRRRLHRPRTTRAGIVADCVSGNAPYVVVKVDDRRDGVPPGPALADRPGHRVRKP